MKRTITVELPIAIDWYESYHKAGEFTAKWRRLSGGGTHRRLQVRLHADGKVSNRTPCRSGRRTEAFGTWVNGELHPTTWDVPNLDEMIRFCKFAGLPEEQIFQEITGREWSELNLFRHYGNRKFREVLDLFLENEDMYSYELARYRRADGQQVD